MRSLSYCVAFWSIFIFCAEKIKWNIIVFNPTWIIFSRRDLVVDRHHHHQRSSPSRAILELHRCAATSSYFIIVRGYWSSSSTIIATIGDHRKLSSSFRLDFVDLHRYPTTSRFITIGYRRRCQPSPRARNLSATSSTTGYLYRHDSSRSVGTGVLLNRLTFDLGSSSL